MDNKHTVPFKQIYNNNPNNILNRSNLVTRLHIDVVLLSCIIPCFIIGLVLIYSAKLELYLVQKQLMNFLVASVMMLIVAHATTRDYRSWAPVLYFGGLSVLILALLIGDISKGGQRWLDFGLIRFQPAELMKIAVPLMVARSLDQQILPPSPKLLL